MLNNRIGMLLRMVFRYQSHIWYRDYKRHINEIKDLHIDKPIDILFLMVDHYEPAKKDGPKALDKVYDWCNN